MAVHAQMYADNLGMPFCGSLDSGGGGGLSNNDFCFNLQHPQQSRQLQQPQRMQQEEQQLLLCQQLLNPQHENQFLALDNNFVFSATKTQPSMATTTINHNHIINNSNISMAFSQSMATRIEKQRREIDGYINLQNERLKLVLRQQRKQQLTAFLRKIEARAAMVLRQKDEEISQAGKRTMELEEFINKTEMENEAWKRVAGESEAMIANLNTTLEQLRERAAICLQQQPSNGVVEDAESCCDENREEEEVGRTKESNGETGAEEDRETGERNRKRRKKMRMMMLCRNCNSGNSSVLFLPCRHLCCCKACEAFLYACPVCKSAKKGSIEALLS